MVRAVVPVVDEDVLGNHVRGLGGEVGSGAVVAGQELVAPHDGPHATLLDPRVQLADILRPQHPRVLALAQIAHANVVEARLVVPDVEVLRLEHLHQFAHEVEDYLVHLGLRGAVVEQVLPSLRALLAFGEVLVLGIAQDVAEVGEARKLRDDLEVAQPGVLHQLLQLRLRGRAVAGDLGPRLVLEIPIDLPHDGVELEQGQQVNHVLVCRNVGRGGRGHVPAAPLHGRLVRDDSAAAERARVVCGEYLADGLHAVEPRAGAARRQGEAFAVDVQPVGFLVGGHAVIRPRAQVNGVARLRRLRSVLDCQFQPVAALQIALEEFGLRALGGITDADLRARIGPEHAWGPFSLDGPGDDRGHVRIRVDLALDGAGRRGGADAKDEITKALRTGVLVTICVGPCEVLLLAAGASCAAELRAPDLAQARRAANLVQGQRELGRP